MHCCCTAVRLEGEIVNKVDRIEAFDHGIALVLRSLPSCVGRAADGPRPQIPDVSAAAAMGERMCKTEVDSGGVTAAAST